MNTKKEIKLKDGSTLPKGLPVTFLPDEPSRCMVQGERAEPYRVRITSAFPAPSLARLERANDEGICPSVAGGRTEPDGWCDKGSPSWMLALGLI